MKTLVELFVYDDDEAVASIQVLEFAAPNDVSTRVSEVYGRFVMRRVTPGHPPVTRLYTEPADAVSGALRAAGWGELALSAGEYGDGS